MSEHTVKDANRGTVVNEQDRRKKPVLQLANDLARIPALIAAIAGIWAVAGTFNTISDNVSQDCQGIRALIKGTTTPGHSRLQIQIGREELQNFRHC